MFYEVRAHLFFDEEDEAKDFYHDCELALAKSTVVNPGQLNMEFGSIDTVENHHDQDPSQPCQLLVFANNKPEH